MSMAEHSGFTRMASTACLRTLTPRSGRCKRSNFVVSEWWRWIFRLPLLDRRSFCIGVLCCTDHRDIECDGRFGVAFHVDLTFIFKKDSARTLRLEINRFYECRSCINRRQLSKWPSFLKRNCLHVGPREMQNVSPHIAPLPRSNQRVFLFQEMRDIAQTQRETKKWRSNRSRPEGTDQQIRSGGEPQTDYNTLFHSHTCFACIDGTYCSVSIGSAIMNLWWIGSRAIIQSNDWT